MTRGTTTLDCSQRIASVVTPNSIKTAVAVHRTRIARKSGARQTSFLAHLGSVLISKPVCGEVSTHEPRGNDPANAREKDTRRRQCVEKTLDNTSDVDKIAVTEHPTRIARTTSARWTSFCMHLGLVPSRNKHAKMSPSELGVLIMEPPEKCVSEGDGL